MSAYMPIMVAFGCAKRGLRETGSLIAPVSDRRFLAQTSTPGSGLSHLRAFQRNLKSPIENPQFFVILSPIIFVIRRPL
jgi:hypothetical protein